MRTVIHLRTARVYSSDTDGMPKIERTTVKLEDGDNFKKFVKHMHLKGFIKNEPPKVVKVIQQKKDGSFKDLNIDKWQAMVEDALTNQAVLVSTKVDYKKLSEKQAEELSELKEMNASFEDRLAALEAGKDDDTPDLTPREILVAKATELELTFAANISNAKLLEKIQEVEFDFKLEED